MFFFNLLASIQLCPTEIAYKVKNYVTILTRAAHSMTYFDLSKLHLVYGNVLKAFESQLQCYLTTF